MNKIKIYPMFSLLNNSNKCLNIKCFSFFSRKAKSPDAKMTLEATNLRSDVSDRSGNAQSLGRMSSRPPQIRVSTVS